MKIKETIKTAACGAVIGVAMIIPGVSGGTLAVLLNIYDKIISSISDFFKDIKASLAFLIPLLLGAVIAIAAMFFPLKLALEYAPLPTVMLFVGLMIGSIPQLLKDTVKNGFKSLNLISLIVPLVVVIGVCFIPSVGEVDLSDSMIFIDYMLLLIMGLFASCALVIPGISGSMLLMIFGYYNQLFATVSAIPENPLHSILVLGVFALGVAVGFFTIAKIMKWLLNKFPRGTYWSIFGFVIGSIPAIFITFDYANSPLGAPHILVGCVLLVLGIIATYCLCNFMNSKNIDKQN